MTYKNKSASGWVFKIALLTTAVYWSWVFFGNVYWFENVDLWETPFNSSVDEWFGANNNLAWLPGAVVVAAYSVQFILVLTGVCFCTYYVRVCFFGDDRGERL